ncbi:MAG: PD-(D/E)XK nuclease-like domain-containing protein [Bacteroidota bacterium]
MRYTTDFKPEFDKRPLSYSSLKAFQKSPQHYVEYRLTKFEPTASMVFGQIIDILILTPDEYDRKFAIMPDDIKKPTSSQLNAKKPSPETIIQVQKFTEWAEENRGKTWINSEDAELAKFLANKTFENPKAKELLSRITRTQDKVSWSHRATGLPLIGYKDATADSFIMDLKSSNDGSPEGFTKAAFNFGYHLQVGSYLDAEETLFGKFPDFFFLVVETLPPYNISVYKADKDFIALGKQQFNDLLQQIKFCEENNLWHQGYEFHSATGYHQLDLPGWAKNKLNK